MPSTYIRRILEASVYDVAVETPIHPMPLLEAAGSSLQQVVKTTVFLQDMNDFQQMNAVYAEAFGDHAPARATVEVARLPKNVLVEVECIALVD